MHAPRRRTIRWERMNRANREKHAIVEFAIPSPRSGPYSVAAGPDGALWFTEIHAGRIGRASAGGEITEFALPTPHAGPSIIVAGGDGALWFTEFRAHRIGRI